MSGDALVARDAAAVWHPYAAPTLNPPPVPIASARGVRLTMEDGRELIDGMSSWWAAIHGYGHPKMLAAMHAQLDRMSHVMFGGITHAPAVELSERLCAIVPGKPQRAFLCDSGSVAVEVAIKMALQYWIARGQPRRRRLLTVRGGYHGDTFATMAVCDPVNGMHTLFEGTLAQHLFAPRPEPRFGEPCEDAHMRGLRDLLGAHGAEVAAIVLEPIVQGAGGMWFYSAEYLRRVRQLCDTHGVLLIADEIATGFGRTGALFACEHADIAADITCIGKSLTGGMISLAATLASAEVCEAVAAGEPGVLMHGPTYMGNPLACSAGLASLDLLAEGSWRGRVTAIEAQLRRELEPCRTLEGVADVRVLGAIGVVELEEPVVMAEVQPAFVERGVWVRPFGKLVYLMPPFVIEPADLTTLTSATAEVVALAVR